MDLEEKQRLTRRIVAGKFYADVKYQNKIYKVVFQDPGLELMIEGDYVYKNALSLGKEDNLMSIEESYEILKKDGLWSDQLDIEMQKTTSDIKAFQERLPSLKFLKQQFKMTKSAIETAEKRLADLNEQKNQLYCNTLEYYAEKCKRKFLIASMTSGYPESFKISDQFLDTLIVYYYKHNSVSEKQIRELARSDPWRVFWTVSKSTGSSLFNHSSIEMTELQYALVSWTRVYDFAYESQSSPSDEVLEDDISFDSWYKQECDRINKERNTTSMSSGLGGKYGNQEVFIPADSEGAKDVYALNDPMTRAKIKQRQNFINKNLVVQEDQLPDVKKDISMRLNQMYADKHAK